MTTLCCVSMHIEQWADFLLGVDAKSEIGNDDGDMHPGAGDPYASIATNYQVPWEGHRH